MICRSGCDAVHRFQIRTVGAAELATLRGRRGGGPAKQRGEGGHGECSSAGRRGGVTKLTMRMSKGEKRNRKRLTDLRQGRPEGRGLGSHPCPRPCWTDTPDPSQPVFVDESAPSACQPRSAAMPTSPRYLTNKADHFVKDRMDITGARWSADGAEALQTQGCPITPGVAP